MELTYQTSQSMVSTPYSGVEVGSRGVDPGEIRVGFSSLRTEGTFPLKYDEVISAP
jgi:hypothetical protein